MTVVQTRALPIFNNFTIYYFCIKIYRCWSVKINKIEIIKLNKNELKEIDDIKKTIDIAIKVEKLDNIEFNIIIVDNEYIHKLNREYRKIDRPTDVITFALEDYKDIELEHRILGDIYISFDKAISQ